MILESENVKYIYKKYKNLPIPFGATGKVIRYVDNPVTTKLIVDFKEYGIAIVPLSAIEAV
jgi:hypothetical protein